jgi:Ca2+-binding RTX toxin-like protein
VIAGAGAAQAAASGTVTIAGNSIVYAGDGSTEHVRIDKEVQSDSNGTPTGFWYSVQDIRGGGLARGLAPCRADPTADAYCPFGSSLLRVTLAGGADDFASEDQTVELYHNHCRANQASAAVRLDAGAGNDDVRTTPLPDVVKGGAGNDAIETYAGADTVSGGPGSDLIDTFDGNDVVDGGTGRDLIALDVRGSGSDGCYRRRGKAGNDVARGGPGNDSISGIAGNDRIDGGPGNDNLLGGKGHDTLLGGKGRDRIYSRDGRRDTVNCGPGRDKLLASDRQDRVKGCEKRFLRPR